MQKYLTQHSLNAFTIKLPRNLKLNNQSLISLKDSYLLKPDELLLNHFASFIQSHYKKKFNDLPIFNFLITFYNVRFIKEIDELFVFNLNLNETLNQNILLRLKHTLFNQYNSLIGFSDVLQDVEVLDDNDRLLIKRINHNAREMFKNTKLLMEFEQLKNFNFELEYQMSQPFNYLSSFLNYRKDIAENISFDFNHAEIENIVINIENPYFKTSLNLFFDLINEMGDFSDAKLRLDVKNNCHIRFEYKYNAINNGEFINEIQSFNDFFYKGINITNTSNHIFYLLYIKLIAEKLGGEFKFEISGAPDFILLAEWIFPFVKTDMPQDVSIDSNHISNSHGSNLMPSRVTELYPNELRIEIANHFSKVEGNFVLDEWKILADKLDDICLKYKINNLSELIQIAKDIRVAVDGFDVKALQSIMNRIRQICNIE
jgi:hypothetical protein